MLCELCTTFASQVNRQDFRTWKLRPGLSPNIHVFCYEHGTYDAIREFALSGCEFCAFFLRITVDVHDHVSLEQGACLKIEFERRYSDEWRPKTTFTIDNTPFELFDGRPDERLLEPSTKSSGNLPFAVSDRPDSAVCIAQVKSWLRNCESDHPSCTRKSPVPLPTRVIDVQTAESAEELRLLLTRGALGQYVTLSHCWGRSEHLKTTKSNVEDHEKSIRWELLAANFRDAITVTRLLGFRYLWIDSLCIIQDDAEDWSREAAQMCTVYESAVLSLSAFDEPGSCSGFLQPRHAQHVSATVYGWNIGIRRPMSVPRYITGSVLETRAWTMQERILAPAVLHFGSEELYWECSTGMASETGPAVQEDRRGAASLYYNLNIHDMKLILRNLVHVANIIVWHDVIKAYTERKLTRPSDRLPAIRGLAGKFGRCFNATYLAGVWSQSMHTGLLWYCLNPAQDLTQLESFRQRIATVPTWSWASVGSAVAHASVSRTYGGKGVIAKAEIKALFEDSDAGRLLFGDVALKITGLMTQGLWFVNSQRSNTCNFVAAGSKYPFDYIKGNFDCLSDDVVHFNGLVPGFCLLIAEEQMSEDASIRYFLLLKKSAIRLAHDDQIGISERIGSGSQELSNGQISSTFADASEVTLVLV